ncbi:MAG: hypothetical protein ACREPZ_06360, partial [Rhodanobacteraceae bacterium]
MRRGSLAAAVHRDRALARRPLLDTLANGIGEYKDMDEDNSVALEAGTLAAEPPRQAQRLAALRSYDILDTPVEGAFEDITRIAALVCRVTIAA